jgi:hypothetical protein
MGQPHHGKGGEALPITERSLPSEMYTFQSAGFFLVYSFVLGWLY